MQRERERARDGRRRHHEQMRQRPSARRRRGAARARWRHAEAVLLVDDRPAADRGSRPARPGAPASRPAARAPARDGAPATRRSRARAVRAARRQQRDARKPRRAASGRERARVLLGEHLGRRHEQRLPAGAPRPAPRPRTPPRSCRCRRRRPAAAASARAPRRSRAISSMARACAAVSEKPQRRAPRARARRAPRRAAHGASRARRRRGAPQQERELHRDEQPRAPAAGAPARGPDERRQRLALDRVGAAHAARAAPRRASGRPSRARAAAGSDSGARRRSARASAAATIALDDARRPPLRRARVARAHRRGPARVPPRAASAAVTLVGWTSSRTPVGRRCRSGPASATGAPFANAFDMPGGGRNQRARTRRSRLASTTTSSNRRGNTWTRRTRPPHQHDRRRRATSASAAIGVTRPQIVVAARQPQQQIARRSRGRAPPGAPRVTGPAPGKPEQWRSSSARPRGSPARHRLYVNRSS